MGKPSRASMKAALWAVPAVAAVGLAMFGLSRVPFERIGWQPKSEKAKKAIIPPVEPPPLPKYAAVNSEAKKLPEPVSEPLQARQSEPPPPGPVEPARPPEASPVSRIPNSEASLYANEITRLEGSSQIKMQGSREASGIGALDMAIRYAEQARHDLSVVTCLKNQLGLGVPYYQGRSTCATAVPAPKEK